VLGSYSDPVVPLRYFAACIGRFRWGDASTEITTACLRFDSRDMARSYVRYRGSLAASLTIAARHGWGAMSVSRSGAPGRWSLARYRKSRTLQADVLVVHLAVALPLLEPKLGQIQA
jgi:hypothetical protein